MNRLAWVVAGSALLVVVGACAGTQGYPDPKLSPNQIASIKCRHEPVPGFFTTFAVSIVKINGATEFEKWTAPTFNVDLLPGEYELDLIANLQSGTPRAMADSARDRHPKHVTLTVVAGHSYVIGFDTEDDYYLLVDIPSLGTQEAEFPARGSAERCKLALAHDDRDACEAQAVRLSQAASQQAAERKPGDWRKVK